LTASAVALAASWIYWNGFTFESRLALGAVVFAALILVGDVFPLRVSDRTPIRVWDVGLIVAVATLGPTWAAVAALPSAVYVGRREWLRTIYEIGHSVTMVYLAGIVFSFASKPLWLAEEAAVTSQAVYGTFAMGSALVGANMAIAAVLLKIKYDQSIYDTYKRDVEPYLFSDVLNVLTAGLGVLILLTYGPIAALVAVGGALGSQVLVYRSREQVYKNDELRE
jgi:hypothetical protein